MKNSSLTKFPEVDDLEVEAELVACSQVEAPEVKAKLGACAIDSVKHT